MKNDMPDAIIVAIKPQRANEGHEDEKHFMSAER
jgi:hypothetical protein